MWALVLKLLPVVLGWFGIGSSKSDTQAAQEAGEKQGQAEAGKAEDDKIIEDVSEANAARRSVRDDPSGLRKPDEFSRD